MIFVRAHCEVSGKGFSPETASRRTTLRFTRQIEPGQTVERGPRRGLPSEFGYAQLAVFVDEIGPRAVKHADASNGADEDHGAILLSKLPAVVSSLRELGAESVTLFLDVAYLEQCNFELTPQVLALLAEAKVVVAVSCYQADEEWAWLPPSKAGRIRP